MPMAKSAAETAVRLDDTLADAHATLGFIRLFYDWDAPAAEKELTRALELNPSLSAARINHAGYFLATGKREEAIPEIHQAIQLDPLSLRTQALGTIFLIFAQHYDEAMEQARKALDLEPRFGIEKAAQLDNGATVGLFRAHVHAVAGHKERAQELVGEMEKATEHAYICPYEVAAAYVSLKKNDKAYQWLRKGIEEHADCMAWLGVEPWMEPFRADPRYNELLREVGARDGRPKQTRQIA